jgi:hypothetical protein
MGIVERVRRGGPSVARLRRVYVLGWRRALPSLEGFHAQPVTVDGLRAAVEESRAAGGLVLVVGEQALEATAPEAVLGFVHWPGSLVIVVPGRASMAAVIRWRDAGARIVIDEQDLRIRLRALVAMPFRGEVPQAAWAPRIIGNRTEAERLLRMIPGLLKVSVHAWAAEARRSERSFQNDCRSLFAARPHEILWAYKRACNRAERAEGRTERERCRALGFANPANLRRAYRIRKECRPGAEGDSENDSGLPKVTLDGEKN